MAALRGRDYVLPDEVKELAGPVLAHRLLLQPEERLRWITIHEVLDDIIEQVPVPAPVE